MKRQSVFRLTKYWGQFVLLLALFAGLFGGHSASVRAAGLVVNSAADDMWAHDSMAGDGICLDALTRCTLRAAIEEANALSGLDTITFDAAMQIPINPNENGLPALTETAIIDASSVWDTANDQPGVTINGSGISFSGIALWAAGCQVYGLLITNFDAPGIYISSDNNIIGGADAGQRNVLSGNSAGITLSSSTALSNFIRNNYIGVTPSGDQAVPNDNGLVITDGANMNTIGGDQAKYGNLISGNTYYGVIIEKSDTNNNWLGNNVIGLAADRSTALGNGFAGIYIQNGPQSTMIGGGQGLGNIISYNQGHGIYLNHGGENNQISNNLISGNAIDGVSISESADTVVSDNLIVGNQYHGVRVYGNSAIGNLIWPNSITANDLKGIYLQGGGNLNIAAPIITTASSNGAAGTACMGCRVVFYSDADDEGQIQGGFVTADGAGKWRYTGFLVGPNVTATAIDGDNNTSEFSTPKPIDNLFYIFLPALAKSP